MRKYIIYFILLFPIISIGAGIGGAYTINSNIASGADYNTISDAISDMYLYGLNDDVTFTLVGDFTEQLNFDGFINNSDIFEIVFTSSSNASIDYLSSLSSDNFVVQLNGTGNITFENLRISAKGTSFTRVIISDNPQGNLKFIGNIFESDLNATSSTDQNLVQLTANSPTEYLNNIEFIDNEFSGGYHGLFLESNNLSQTLNFSLVNNTFTSNIIGLSIIGFDSPEISNNQFNLINSIGISLDNCANDFIISNNTINTESTSDNSGLIISNTNNLNSIRGSVVNNFFQANNSGIVVNNSEYIDFYFNSVNILDDPLSTNSASVTFSHDEYCKNLDVRNNILNNRRKGYALVGHKSPSNNIDYNNYFTNGTWLINWNTLDNFSSLSSFINSTSTNNNSYNEDVIFVSRTDLHIQTSPYPLLGIDIPNISSDIDSELRINPPIIGADEIEYPLHGSFTVGVSGDFLTISNAINAMSSKGIDGEVIFNILDGIYNEQVEIVGPITGSSPTNIITFQSNSGNPSDSEINFTVNDLYDNFVFRIDNAENIIIRNLTIVAEHDSFGTAIALKNGCENITIEGNVLSGKEITEDPLHPSNARTLFQAGYFRNLNINIINNQFINCHYGIKITFTNSLATMHENITISGNTIDALYTALSIHDVSSLNVSSNILKSHKSYTIRLRDCDYPEVRNNTMNFEKLPLVGYSSFWGCIYIKDLFNGCNINSNIMISTHDGVYFEDSDASSTNYQKVYNNLISAENAGIYMNRSSYVDIKHNTINNYAGLYAAGTSAFFTAYNCDNIILTNNLMSGYYNVISMLNLPTNFNSDYNNFFSESGQIAKIGIVHYETLTDYQNLTGTDANSFSEAISFINDTTDLHIADYATPLLGIPIVGFEFDIDGEVRGNPPFIGADEPIGTNVSISLFLEGPYSLGNSNMNVSLSIPTTSPYLEDPESVNAIPNIVVDWVLVELRNKDNNSDVLESQSAFILQDGTIVDIDGVSPVHFSRPLGDYFISIKHRNHLAVMSANAVQVN